MTAFVTPLWVFASRLRCFLQAGVFACWSPRAYVVRARFTGRTRAVIAEGAAVLYLNATGGWREAGEALHFCSRDAAQEVLEHLENQLRPPFSDIVVLEVAMMKRHRTCLQGPLNSLPQPSRSLHA